jgi:hypothetical protein
MGARRGSYPATERKWVKQLLAKLTPEERAVYERRCREAPVHPHSRKLYDGEKAKIAEQVMIEFRRRRPN